MNVKKKICPEGKILNSKTGRCVKEKKKKTCPEGKLLNEKTGRCVNDKKKNNKTCPDGKVINERTGRCIKDKKSKTGEKLFLKLNTSTMKIFSEKLSDEEKQKIIKEMVVIRDKIIENGYKKELNRYDFIWSKILRATDKEKKEINDLCELSI